MQSSRVGDYTIWYENTEEFYELKKEIFVEHRYYIELDNIAPRIVDLGAHIGMSVLYWKKLYPEASIVACEPVTENFDLLEKNVLENGLTGIELHKKAVAPKAGEIELQIPNTTGWMSGAGIISRGWRGVQDTSPRRVEAVTFAELLRNGADLVKMDIEGMEYEVVESVDWRRVGAVMIEVHPRAGKRIETIEKKLKLAGFATERREDKSRYGSGLIMLYGRR